MSLWSDIIAGSQEPSVRPFSLLGTNRAPRTVVLKEDLPASIIDDWKSGSLTKDPGRIDLPC